MNFTNYPLSAKSACILVVIIALSYITLLGKEILCPLVFSLLFSILLLPIATFLEKKTKFPRSAASFVSVIFLIATISLLFYFVGTQIQNLASDWPLFKEQLGESIELLQIWIADKFHVDADKQLTYVHSTTNKILASGTSVVGATVLSLSSILLFLVFVFIYTFFFLLYRRLLLRFLVAVFREENSLVVYDIVKEVQFIIRKYVVGILIEMLCVAVIGCIALLALQIKYAILLGLITGLFNIIPYVGIFTALLLSTLITFATTGLISKIVLVMIVVISIHLVDSNILLPMIVGSKVKINAFITVLGVVVGEMLWGISGMFLSIPVIAILKIIFDRIDSLKPWGLILGEDEKPALAVSDIKNK